MHFLTPMILLAVRNVAWIKYFRAISLGHVQSLPRDHDKDGRGIVRNFIVHIANSATNFGADPTSGSIFVRGETWAEEARISFERSRNGRVQVLFPLFLTVIHIFRRVPGAIRYYSTDNDRH